MNSTRKHTPYIQSDYLIEKSHNHLVSTCAIRAPALIKAMD